MNILLEKFKAMKSQSDAYTDSNNNANNNVNEGFFDSLLSNKIYNLDDIDDLLNKIVDSDRYYNNLDTNIDEPDSSSITFKFYFVKKDKPINLNISCSPNNWTRGYVFDNLPNENIDRFTNKGFYSRYINADNDIKDIISKCDTRRIYNVYSVVANTIMRDYFIQAYLLFNSDNIVKTCVNQGTLSVAYSSQFDKFIYRYNPDFILETAMYEYINSPDAYRCKFKNAYVYTLAFLISHEMMHLITNNVTSSGLNSIVNLDSGANRTDNIVTDSFINCSLSRIFARVPIIRNDDEGYAPLLTVGINSEFQFRNQLGKGFKNFKDSKEFLSTIIDVLVKYSQNTWDTNSFDYTKTLISELDKYLPDIVGCDFLGKINIPAGYTNIRSSSAYFQRFITDMVRVFTDGEIYTMDTELTEKEQLEDLSKDRIPEGTLVRVANTMDICYVHKGEIYNIDQYTKSVRYHLTNAKRTGVNKQPVDNNKKLYLCSYTYEDTNEPYNDDNPIDFSQLILLDSENAWYESTDVVDSNQEADKAKLSKEDLQKADTSYNSIVAYVCEMYFKDSWAFSDFVRDIINKGIALKKYTDSELKVISQYKDTNSNLSADLINRTIYDDIIVNNRDNDYCIQVLGKYTVDKITDYADKKSYEALNSSDEDEDKEQNDVTKSLLDNPAVKKLMQSKEAQDIMKNLKDFYDMGKQNNTNKVLGVGSIVYIRSLNLFGRIVNINQDGTYNIEECKESPSIVLDDSDKDRGGSDE